MYESRKQFGEIMIEMGCVTQEQVDVALERQMQGDARKLGEDPGPHAELRFRSGGMGRAVAEEGAERRLGAFARKLRHGRVDSERRRGAIAHDGRGKEHDKDEQRDEKTPRHAAMLTVI